MSFKQLTFFQTVLKSWMFFKTKFMIHFNSKFSGLYLKILVLYCKVSLWGFSSQKISGTFSKKIISLKKWNFECEKHNQIFCSFHSLNYYLSSSLTYFISLVLLLSQEHPTLLYYGLHRSLIVKVYISKHYPVHKILSVQEITYVLYFNFVELLYFIAVFYLGAWW